MSRSRGKQKREPKGPLGVPAATRWEQDVYALLTHTDAKRIKVARLRMEHDLRSGIRYFSSMGQIVALEYAEFAAKEIAALERAANSQDVDPLETLEPSAGLASNGGQGRLPLK